MVLKFQRFTKWHFLLLFSVLAVFPCLFSFISALVCACVHGLCVTSSTSAASERQKQRPDLPGGLDPPSHSCLRAARRYPIRQVSEGKRGVHQKERRKANEPRRRSPRHMGGRHERDPSETEGKGGRRRSNTLTPLIYLSIYLF